MVEGFCDVRNFSSAIKVFDALEIFRSVLRKVRHAKDSAFLRDVAETLATRVAVLFLGLVASVIIARILGPVGRGLYAVAIAMTSIGVQFGNLGLHASNTYFVAREPKSLDTLIGNTLATSMVLGGVGSFIVWAVLTWLPQIAPVHGYILALGLAAVPFSLLSLLLQNLLIGVGRVRASNFIELGTRAFGVVLILILAALRMVSVQALLIASLIVFLVSSGSMFSRLREGSSHPLRFSGPLLSRCVHFGLRIYVTAMFSFLVIRADLFLIQFLLGAEETGYYSIATSLADLIYLLPVITGSLLFPRLSALTTSGERMILVKKVTTVLGLAMLAIATAIIACARPLVSAIFGEPYLPAVPAIAWLMPGIVALSLNTLYMNYFASVGMPRFAIYSTGLALALNIMLNLKLIPHYGIVGAAVASTVTYVLMLSSSIAFVRSQSMKSS